MKVFSSKRVSDSWSGNLKSKIENLKLVGLGRHRGHIRFVWGGGESKKREVI